MERMFVVILIAGIFAVGIIALVSSYLLNRRNEKKGLPGAGEVLKTVDAECCGQHTVCEKESLLAAVSKNIEYYDDEELDEYAGMDADAYTEEQVEQFRDILYTMRQDDVAGWCRSLQLRKIEIPDAIKDEIFLIVGERRGNNVK